MEICIRKEPNGLIYISKTALNRFDKATLRQPPYNFSFVQVDKEDFVSSDFNDDLSFSLEKYNARKNAEKLERLRIQRATECFPIVNRGQLWYEMLTDAQKSELSAWYNAWLDVTETLVVPTKPSWLR